MKRSYVCAALAALPLVALASPALAYFSGSYALHIRYGYPDQRKDKMCAIFTHGDVLGYPDSGTWTLSRYDLPGNFIVDGDDLRFYLAYGNGVFNFHIKIKDGVPQGQGGVDNWRAIIPTTPPDALADGVFKMTATTEC
jgi:hypothetical protein